MMLTGFAVPESPVRALTGANLSRDPRIVKPMVASVPPEVKDRNGNQQRL
jgi:hypothetical protein